MHASLDCIRLPSHQSCREAVSTSGRDHRCVSNHCWQLSRHSTTLRHARLSCRAQKVEGERATGSLEVALDELARQQEGVEKDVYDLDATKVLVETAMFAAVGGLAFSIAAVLKLQGYMGYLLPMPIVLSAIRSGPAVARKTTVATAFLLFVLLGPLQAISYLLQHGVTSWALGTAWHLRWTWFVSILWASIARMLGTIGFLAFSSWTVNENLYRLFVTQIHGLLDQLSGVMGISGSPSPLLIQVFMACSLLINCIMYISLLHVMYAVFLRSMGYQSMRIPQFLEKRLLPPQLQTPTKEN